MRPLFSVDNRLPVGYYYGRYGKMRAWLATVSPHVRRMLTLGPTRGRSFSSPSSLTPHDSLVPSKAEGPPATSPKSFRTCTYTGTRLISFQICSYKLPLLIFPGIFTYETPGVGGACRSALFASRLPCRDLGEGGYPSSARLPSCNLQLLVPRDKYLFSGRLPISSPQLPVSRMVSSVNQISSR
jgi:hypothetical protein